MLIPVALQFSLELLKVCFLEQQLYQLLFQIWVCLCLYLYQLGLADWLVESIHECKGMLYHSHDRP